MLLRQQDEISQTRPTLVSVLYLSHVFFCAEKNTSDCSESLDHSGQRNVLPQHRHLLCHVRLADVLERAQWSLWKKINNRKIPRNGAERLNLSQKLSPTFHCTALCHRAHKRRLQHLGGHQTPETHMYSICSGTVDAHMLHWILETVDYFNPIVGFFAVCLYGDEIVDVHILTGIYGSSSFNLKSRDTTSASAQCRHRHRTAGSYHEAETSLQVNVPDATVAFEEPLHILLPGRRAQPADENTTTAHVSTTTYL